MKASATSSRSRLAALSAHSDCLVIKIWALAVCHVLSCPGQTMQILQGLDRSGRQLTEQLAPVQTACPRPPDGLRGR